MHRFILQAIDPVLGCPVLETMLVVEDLEALRSVLGLDSLDDPELTASYNLDPGEAHAINDRFELEFEVDGRECALYRAYPIGEYPDLAPYLIHTGYELALMLDGVKPFAKFYLEYPSEADEWVPEALFEPYVQSGVLIKRVTADEPFDKPIRQHGGRMSEGIRQIFYARRGEEWRIDAHLLVWRQLKHGRWNETLERLEGSLLGYTDAQNAWGSTRRRRDHVVHADWTFYLGVNADEQAWIHRVGERALSPDPAGATLKLMMCWPRPQPAELVQWMETSTAAAIVRFGVSRDFLKDREREDINGTPCYSIPREEIPALNRALASSIEIIAERAVAKSASATA